ncbi:MAG TPA: phage/plasmid primase, P4 family [Polyangiaceae bacterium]|nr:phage/plasmid primase, P4 family [Polyangiaceae bacterium]
MSTPKPLAKVREIHERRKRKAEAENTPAAYTDLGSASHLALELGHVVRYVGTWSSWLVFDGRRWVRDEQRRVEALAADVIRADLARAAEEIKVAAETNTLAPGANDRVKWALKSHDAKRIRAAVSLIPAADQRLAITHRALDCDPWALNVANGTLDLRTGKLRPHDSADLVTKLVPVIFDPAAKCPTWETFLVKAMGGDAELVAYLQRMIGYALTGVVREHVLGFLFGGGANGKSTFLSTMHALFGDYGARAPRGLLFKHQGSQHETNLTTLFAARFVSCAEIGEADAFDEALVKDLTGGDPISARRMREDFWTFDPTHKLFIAGNHRPRVRGTDEGIWRRIRLIPWSVEIPKAERDPELPTKLLAELPGILAWAVRGCAAWQAQGLGEPVAVSEATAAYREASDPLREFFEGYLVFGDHGAKVARRVLREAYELWARENGAEPLGAKRFAEGLRIRGVTDSKVRVFGKPVDAWQGVRFRTDDERMGEAAE